MRAELAAPGPLARFRRQLIRAGLLCGLVAPILWAVVIVVAGALRPGFEHLGQYISELGERGADNAALMRYGGFVATGLLHLGYAAALGATLGRSSRRRALALLVAVLVAMNGLGRIGAGVFSCEPGCEGAESATQRLHHGAASLAFLSIAAAALLGGRLFRGERALQGLAGYSVLSGAAGLLFLALMSAGGALDAYVGLFERLASGVLSLWVLVTALSLWRHNPGRAQ